MKSFKIFVLSAALSLVSFASFAQSVTACSSTLEEAEAKIAEQAKAADASYKITEAYNNNGVHMTAELLK